MFEIAKARQLGEPRGFVLEAQYAAAIEELILRFHDRRHVACGDSPVVANGVAREPFRVRGRQAGEILNEELERRLVHVDPATAFVGVLRRAALHDRAPILRVRQSQREARRVAAELVRNLEPMSDQ